MDNNEFNDLVNKYKEELMMMSKSNSQISQNSSNTKVKQGDFSEVNNLPDGGDGRNSSALVENQGETIKDSQDKTYAQFLFENIGRGYLKIQATTAREVIPIQGVKIIVSKKFKDQEKIFYQAETDVNGIVDGLILPAPIKELSEQPSDIIPYTNYNIKAIHPDYKTEEYTNVNIFDGVKSIQRVKMLPKGMS